MAFLEHQLLEVVVQASMNMSSHHRLLNPEQGLDEQGLAEIPQTSLESQKSLRERIDLPNVPSQSEVQRCLWALEAPSREPLSRAQLPSQLP